MPFFKLSSRLTSIFCLLAITATAVAATVKAPSTSSRTRTTSKTTKKASVVKAATHSKSRTKTSKTSKTKRSKRVASWKSRGQHTIDSARTRQIQEALIREHFLDGEVNGNWDTKTQEAMRRFQAANSWQTKVLPDSRAIIKLGLGPDHAVLNPETAARSPYLPGGGERAEAPVASGLGGSVQ